MSCATRIGFSSLIINLCIKQNLFPVRIENVLTASPAIREAAAVSVPDARFGEVVGAWIVLEESYRGKIQKEDVRKIVSTKMNPQVFDPTSARP